MSAVIVDDLRRPRRALAARRASPPSLAGRWEFPGGKVEEGETPTAALRRELSEELEIEVRLGAEIEAPEGGRWPISTLHEMRTWLAEITGGQPCVTRSHDEVRWLTVDELGGLDWLDADRAIVDELTRRLGPTSSAGPQGERGASRPGADKAHLLAIAPAAYDDPDVVELTRQVQAYYLELYGGPDSSPMTAGELAPPYGQFLLARQGGRPVAMGGWRFVPEVTQTDAARPVELKRMFVRPEARGRGLGQHLLQCLERDAAAAGADWALLQTGRPQVDAIRLYRRMGYREVTPFGYFAGMDDAVHLGRRLDGRAVAGA